MKKFVIVKDKDTINKLLSQGYIVASVVDGTYTFLNLPTNKIDFDKNTMVYSDILQM